MANKCEPMMLYKAERELIKYLRNLRFGNVELRVQDGLPMMAERAIIKTKFIDDEESEEE